jgi:threonine/homoserine/homoserine lactone efflux protein
MTMFQSLLAFIAAASVLTVTPGVDTAMVLRTAASGGPRRAFLAAAGIGLGCLVWGGAVAIGLGALLAASELAFVILKWAGATYLVWLGLNLIVRPRRSLNMDPVKTRSRPANRSGDGLQLLGRGFLTNVLNPKVGVFYVTFLPQFVPEGTSVAGFSFLLAAIHVALGMIWFTVLIAATIPLARIFARPGVVTMMDRLTGAVFIAFGVKLALARR